MPTENDVPGKPSFRREEKMKTFPEKQKPRESISTVLSLQGTLKGGRTRCPAVEALGTQG